MRKTILALAPAMLLMSTAAQAAPPPWKVSEVSGKVQLGENGRSRAAVRGALLASGATITTAPGARAVIVRGEEFVVISPNTRLRVPEAAEAGGIMQMIEEFGTALFKIKKKSTPHFGVKTPYLAAVVKGTTFTVTVGPEGGTVQVTEGAVEVSTLDGGAADLVTPGAIAMVGASDLYRLSIEGESAKVLRSNEAPPAGAVTTSAVPAAVPAYVGPATSSVDITAPVAEAAKPLVEVTGGLVGGSAGVELAAAEAADQSRGAQRFERGKDDNVPGGGNDNKPDKDKPDASKPDKDKPEKPDEAKPDKDKPDKDKPDEAKPDKDKPEEPKPDAAKAEEPKADKPADDAGDKGDKGSKDEDGKGDKPDKGPGDEAAAPGTAPVEIVPVEGSSGSDGGSSGTGSDDAGEGSSSDIGSGGGEGDSGSSGTGSAGGDSGSSGSESDAGEGDSSGSSGDSGSDTGDSDSSGSGSSDEDDSGSSGSDSGGSDGSDSGSSDSSDDSSGDSDSDGSDSGSSDDADSDESGSGSSGGGDSSGSGSGGFAGGVALPGTDPGDAFDDDLGGDDDDDDDSDDDGGLCLLGLVCLGGDDGPGSSD